MSSDIAEILLDPNKKIEEVRGVLPMLFRKILSDMNVSNEHFNVLMLKYMSDPTNGFNRDNKRRGYERSNLIKEMRRETMSFKVFLKCIKFLGCRSADFTMRLHWFNNTATEHPISFEVNDMSYEELEGFEEDTTPYAERRVRKSTNTRRMAEPDTEEELNDLEDWADVEY